MSTPSGLYYFENQIEDEKSLLQLLDSREWKPVSESLNGRKVQHYGYLYDYKSGNVREKTTPIPGEFYPLMERVSRLIGDDVAFNQVIVNNYTPGQGISSHTDSPKYGDVIACYTLSSGAVMRFSRGDSQHDLYAKPGSLYVMTGEARDKWKHEMPARKSDVVDGKRVKRDRRVSITFRWVKE